MPQTLMQRPSDVLMGPRLEDRDANVTAQSLFQMGFVPEAVGRALVAALGDARAALDLLRSSTMVKQAPAAAELSVEEEDYLLAQAIEMSLSPAAAGASPPSKKAKASEAPKSTDDANPHWAPPRYVPAGDATARGPRTLSLVEDVEVRDGGFSWQKARAFLDTGNQHMTLVDTRFAARHAIYNPNRAANLLGLPGSSFGDAERWTTIHGVVPGASSRSPVVTIALKVRSEEFIIQAAVSEMGSHDLLIGTDVLGRLFSAGFRIGAGSM